MSNIYLKITIEKNWQFQFQVSFWSAPTHADTIEF